MSSGCILGECYICGDLVYEDEVTFCEDRLKHDHCKTKKTLKQENERLKEALLDIEQLVFANQEIPLYIRDKIQKIIICEAGINPQRKLGGNS